MKILIIYLILINIAAAVVTIHDKRAAKRHQQRVKEFHLLFLAFLGGAPAMYITMLLIRHKTKKPKFMLGIPLIFIIEIAAVLLVLHYVYRII